MDHARSVSVVEREREVARERHGADRVERPALHDREEVGPLDELHDEEGVALVDPRVVDAHDPRVIEGPERLHLALEAGERARVGPGHDLQGDGSAGLLVDRAVDDAHATPAELALEAVASGERPLHAPVLGAAKRADKLGRRLDEPDARRPELVAPDPPADSHEADVRLARGLEVDRRVAHEHRLLARGRDRGAEPVDERGVRLPRALVASEHGDEELEEPEVREDLARGPAGLVRRHGERPRERAQRVADPLVDVGRVHDVRRVVLEVEGKRSLEEVGPRGDRALDEAPRPLAYEAPDLLARPRRQAEGLERGVRARREVVGRVDERPVEVEDDHRTRGARASSTIARAKAVAAASHSSRSPAR